MTTEEKQLIEIFIAGIDSVLAELSQETQVGKHMIEKFTEVKAGYQQRLLEAETPVEVPAEEPAEVVEEEDGQRAVKKFDDGAWVKLEGMHQLTNGDLFHLIESDGSIVRDEEGCEVFVVIDEPFRSINEHNKEVAAVGCKQHTIKRINELTTT